MNDTQFDYQLCGWRVRSSLELNDLSPWDSGNAPVEVRFAFGEVPAQIPDSVLHTRWAQVARGGGQIRMSIAGVSDYLIEHGRRVVISPEMPRDSADVRHFLLGGAVGYLCHQRNVVPVQASAVEIDGKAVLFAGPSGAGKSTLASAFAKLGYRVVADDIAPLAIAEAGATVLPSVSRVRLWPDSAYHAGWQADRLERCREALPKVKAAGRAGTAGPGLAPRAIFHLRPALPDGPSASLTPIPGARAIVALAARICRGRSLLAGVGPAKGLERATDAAKGIPLHFELERRVEFSNLPATIDAISRVLRAAP